ncbi:MAG: STAS domain-containing protein [Actinomycetota bacterium]|nr:STAS domain-containing protein [Actinomycetota bacterium]
MQPRDFEVRTERRNGVNIVSVAGELDLATHEGLGQKLVELGKGEGPIVVDLSACEFVDSSGIRALLMGVKAAGDANGEDGRLVIAGANNQVMRILEMTGVDEAVPLHDSVDSAVEQLS